MTKVNVQTTDGLDTYDADGYSWTDGFLTVWHWAKQPGPYPQDKPPAIKIFMTYAPGVWLRAWTEPRG